MEALVPLNVIRNEDEYDFAVAALNNLLDDGAGDESHPMAATVTTLGDLIATYDELHYPPAKVSPSTILKFLMEQHCLTESQLPEVGGANLVRSILDDSVNLTETQIAALSQRFKLAGSVFR